MAIKKFSSQYTHVDGTQWAGPTYHADTWAEAEALAMEYPVQPMRIIGELIEEIEVPEGVTLAIDRARQRTH